MPTVAKVVGEAVFSVVSAGDLVELTVADEVAGVKPVAVAVALLVTPPASTSACVVT